MLPERRGGRGFGLRGDKLCTWRRIGDGMSRQDLTVDDISRLRAGLRFLESFHDQEPGLFDGQPGRIDGML